ncbi:hypothetical protein PCASD_22914 [Puccinia coronata f. sp. avenae]|uniref:Uncharacterized protein n=1 Tax=Puccinia coronata f. sp. avenae TaxID=200324 RepID=A0A2N5RZL2_9BASI|nr:hypothetical protein PCASD_22914 [Puccinia coronata f. sp. avenae]
MLHVERGEVNKHIYTTGRFSRNCPHPPDAFQEKALGGHLLRVVRTHWSSGAREDTLEAALGPLCPEDSTANRHLDGFVLPPHIPSGHLTTKRPCGHAGKSSSSPQCTVLARGFDSPARPSLVGRSGQRTKSFPLSCRPPKASARRSPECPADANQNWWGAPPRLSDACVSANAGERKDSLRCVLRLPSTPHGVLSEQRAIPPWP